MTRSIIQTAAFLAVAGTTAWAGPGLLAIPVTLPVTARFLTAKKVTVPPCDMKMIWTKGNNFICALPDIDWSGYTRVEVTAIEIAPKNLKKPLTERELQQLKS